MALWFGSSMNGTSPCTYFRECPRVLAWPVAATTSADRQAFGSTITLMVAYIESDRYERLNQATIFRYRLPAAGFRSLEDAGRWVSTLTVLPRRVQEIRHLPGVLQEAGVELVQVDDLESVSALARTSLHLSRIRMRNAIRK